MAFQRELLSRYSHYVFWGHKDTWADFHYVYSSWSSTLMRLGATVRWVSDAPENQSVVTPGCWVMVMNTACKHVPYVDGVDYVMHNMDDAPQLDRRLNIQVYTNALLERRLEQWGLFTYFDGSTLYSPWGTDLMPHEFHDPVYNRTSKDVYWVGVPWWGAVDYWVRVDDILALRGLSLKVVQEISDGENTQLIRSARIAPAFAGPWQVEHDYLSCRLFKNISYGQAGLTNVPAFDLMDAFGLFRGLSNSGHHLAPSEVMEMLVDRTLSMGEEMYKAWVRYQQECIAGFDYATKTRLIFQAFDELKG